MFFDVFRNLVIVISVYWCVNYQHILPDFIICALTNGLTMHREEDYSHHFVH